MEDIVNLEEAMTDKPADIPMPEPTAEAEEKPKRKRGRPKKDAAVPADVIPRRKGKKEEVSAINVDGLAKQIQGVHQLASLFFPGAEIDEMSARMLAEAIADIAQEYNLQFLGKYGKWLNLAMVVTIVELPVVARVRENLERKKKEKAKQQGEVTAMQKGVAAGPPLVAVQ